MTISFIICTYNREKYIYECLHRLQNNTMQEGWEIVLVDNNSTDATPAECERFVKDYAPTQYRYVREVQQGLSHARNRGIKEAKGDWLVFLDDDAMVEEDYIEQLQQSLSAYPTIGAFGGKIIPFFEDGEPNWYSPWSMGFVSAVDMGDKPCLFPANKFPIGANMGVSKEVIHAVGGFNPQLGRTGTNLLAGEEKDLFNRIRANGFAIMYFPNIPVKHCIPAHRTTQEFVERLGYGIGQSEYVRTRQIGAWAYTKRLMVEMIKWGGTLIVWCRYALVGQRHRGNILIRFRRTVTRGLLNR